MGDAPDRASPETKVPSPKKGKHHHTQSSSHQQTAHTYAHRKELLGSIIETRQVISSGHIHPSYQKKKKGKGKGQARLSSSLSISIKPKNQKAGYAKGERKDRETYNENEGGDYEWL
jgi:hypothetical protein